MLKKTLAGKPVTQFSRSIFSTLGTSFVYIRPIAIRAREEKGARTIDRRTPESRPSFTARTRNQALINARITCMLGTTTNRDMHSVSTSEAS